MMVEEVLESDVPAGDVVFECPGVAVVTWDSTSNSVNTSWHGWATSTEYAAVLEAGLVAIRNRHSPWGIVDCRRQKVVKQSDQDWVNQNWMPRALAAGLRRIAMILPTSGLAKMNIDGVLRNVSPAKLDVGYFATIAEAKRWLIGTTTNPLDSRKNEIDSQIPKVEGVLDDHVLSDESLYFNRPGVAVVRWDEASKAVHIEWQGWADSPEIVALNEAGLRALKEHHGSRLLSDSRRMKVIKQSDQDWINQDLFPRALAAGLRRVAVAVPTRDLAMINLDSIAAQIPDDQLAVEYFATVEEARAWLA